MGGTVTDSGNAEVTDRGIVYSTTDNTPTIDEGATTVSVGTGIGAFSQSVTGLSPNTTYYANAYATNSIWTSYGTTTSFKTAAITASLSASPALAEENLDSSSLNVMLSGTTFVDESLDKANFALNKAPSGVSIESVTYTDPTQCTVNLAFDGMDFDSNVKNFSLTIAATELNSGIVLTTDALSTAEPTPAATTVSSSISGLTANETYHYQAKAVSKGGTVSLTRPFRRMSPRLRLTALEGMNPRLKQQN